MKTGDNNLNNFPSKENEDNSKELREKTKGCSFFNRQYVSSRLDIPLKDRIRVLLERLGRSQNWLADQVEVSKGSMSKFVNEEWQPSSKIMVRIAEILECDSVVLFGSSDYWREFSSKIKYPEVKNEI